MHACFFCKTPFELDRANVPLGYFARGRCPECGSVNVLVPGGGGPGAAAAGPAASPPGAVDVSAAEPVIESSEPVAVDEDFAAADVDVDAEE